MLKQDAASNEVIYFNEDAEYNAKNNIKTDVKDCIHELLERFWILKEESKDLYYRVKDNDIELKNFFKEYFLYSLIITEDMAKLEKIPMNPQSWMGKKVHNSIEVFQESYDYALFFWLLSFLESKTTEQQFSLQNICQHFETQEEGNFIWKNGAGYKNRRAIARILKYAIRMKLITVIDLEVDDFLSNGEHDVLLERTAQSSYFIRRFNADINEWTSLEDIRIFMDNEASSIKKQSRYLRKLFLEPVVYESELLEEEQDYLRNYGYSVEKIVSRYSDYQFEQYKNASLLIRNETSIKERYFPTDKAEHKLILLISSHLRNNMFFTLDENDEADISAGDLDTAIKDIQDETDWLWTKKQRERRVSEIRDELIEEMMRWKFICKHDELEGMYRLKGALFRYASS